MRIKKIIGAAYIRARDEVIVLCLNESDSHFRGLVIDTGDCGYNTAGRVCDVFNSDKFIPYELQHLSKEAMNLARMARAILALQNVDRYDVEIDDPGCECCGSSIEYDKHEIGDVIKSSDIDTILREYNDN